jgi:putative acetyltransferase
MIHSALHIRPERADHPQVAGLLAELDAYLGALYAPEDNHILDVQALLQPEVDFAVAARDDRVIACAATRRSPGELQTVGEAYGEIKRMYVAPCARGQGVAERLLDFLEQRLKRDGLTLATLETGRDQLEAVRLYQRCGYVQRGPFGGYPDNGLSLFFEKRLLP